MSHGAVLLAITLFIASKVVKIALARAYERSVRQRRPGTAKATHIIESRGVSWPSRRHSDRAPGRACQPKFTRDNNFTTSRSKRAGTPNPPASAPLRGHATNPERRTSIHSPEFL